MTVSWLTIVALSSVAVYVALRRRPQPYPYPPGPKPDPLIGNIRVMPSSREWLEYTKWGETYNSDIIHIEVLGNHIVILNSSEAVEDLLEKQAKVTSDRPMIPMLALTGWDFNSSLLRYGDVWRKHRKLYQQTMRPELATSFQPVQTEKTKELLQNLLTSPTAFVQHLRTVSAGIVMQIVYGHNAKPVGDRFVELAEDAVTVGGESLLPSASIVNIFPFLRHIPPWVPGTTFHKIGARCYGMVDQMKREPFAFVKEQMAKGIGACMVSEQLEKNTAQGGSQEDEDIIRDFSATIYAAGADTTLATQEAFLHAMVLHPEVQRKAQGEIDRVVGRSRLPAYEDRLSLPYVDAVLREVMRWRPTAPLSLPHGATEDITYRGFYIPKGTMIFPNVWAITRKNYEDPEEFRPERFLNDDGTLNDDERILTFGFGRRLCPGRHFATATVWLTVATVLATFNVVPAKDETGKEIPIDRHSYSPGVVSHPSPFKCAFEIRSSEALRLVRDDPLS